MADTEGCTPPVTSTLPDLSEEQETVAQSILQEIDQHNPGKPNVTLGGYAGTGKSVLSSHLTKRLTEKGLRVAVVAYTGKAVDVLHRKGVPSACTAHRLLYEAEYDKYLKKFRFFRRHALGCDVVVVDEASMISEAIHDDFLRFPIQVIYVGDHGQLEPIGDNAFNIMANPEHRLETIHRQAQNSPLIKFAMAVRTGWVPPKYGNYDGIQVSPRRKFWDLIEDPSFDHIIVGFNKTRIAVNQHLRSLKGIRDSMPVPGDKLLCLQNNYESGMFNGMTVFVESVKETEDPVLLLMNCYDDLGQTYTDILVHKDQFDNPKKIELTRRDRTIGVHLFDHGLASTAHKSQGSEYGKGLILEEIWEEKWDPKRWRYTTTTRFKEDFTLCR